MKTIYSKLTIGLVVVLLVIFSFNNDVFAGGAPANDNCANAVSLTVGGSCTTTAGTTNNATAQLGTAGYPSPACAGSVYKEVWYRFVAPANGTVTIDTQTGGITDSGMGLYSGTCGALTLIECDDDDSNNGSMSMITRSGLTPAATYYIAVWEYGGDNDGTFSICVTSPTCSPCYCASGATSTSDMDITKVTFGSINNTSTYNSLTGSQATATGTAGMYSDFTNVPIPNITAGATTPLTVTITQGSSNYSHQVLVYIDFNQDGDLIDAGESFTVWAYANSGATNVITANINIPVGATLGNTQMRVVCVESSTTPWSPCGTFTWGETEDYKINIVAATACSGTPTGGTATASPTSVCSGAAVTLDVTGASINSGLTYQWQSGPAAGGPWTNISGATSATHTVNPTTTTFYRRVITCTSSGLSANSSSVQVTVNPLSVSCYCTSAATSTSDMDITNVNFGSINNTSTYNSLTGTQGTATGTAGMYSNFSTVPVPSILAGISTPLNITITQGSSNYSHQVVVYIDFNQNGLLTDAGESFVVWAYANSGATNNIATNIAVPVSAVSGNTLMRVVCVESSTVNPCGTFTWGETEDYMISITPAVACSGTPTGGSAAGTPNPVCPGSPVSLSVTGSTVGTGFTYQWQSSTNNTTWTNIAGETSATAVENPTANTYYRRVITCTASAQSANSASVLVNVSGLLASCYCTSSADYTSDMDVTNISFGSASNSTPYNSLSGTLGTATGTAGRYSDFTSFGSAGDVMRGLATPISLQVTQGSFSYSHQVNVYIDLNRDGDLIDAGEEFIVWTYATSGAINNITSSITIPGGTALGTTLMRIVCVESSTVTPCGTYGYGETEDYIINIIAATPCAGTPSAGNAAAASTAACGSSTGPLLSVSGYSYATGITFQWQSSTTSGAGFTNIAGATNATYQVPTAPTVVTYYRVIVTCTNSSLSANSSEVSYQPYTTGQDCGGSIPVCASVMGYSNPGWQGTGNQCDLPTSYCLASAERGSSWYNIPITANGNLRFTIVPNDYNGTVYSETDYDFAIWKVVGTGAVTCAQIAAGTATPLACNYIGDGITGLSVGGNAPAPYSSSYDACFETQLAVTAGETYRLVINNHATSTVGFTIDYSSSTATIAYSGAGSSNLTWSGATSTSWVLPTNWGGCAVPDCTKDVVIPVFSTQPAITSVMGTVTVKDLTINAGATLTIGAGATLQVCGSIYNSGTIIASPTSTIIFTDNVTTHTLSGNFTGISKLGNLTITRTAGTCTVTANADVEIGGNFTTSNANSLFNSNGRVITIAGHFLNNAAGTTFTGVNTSSSELIFNGTTLQSYSPGGVLTLNHVTMNHTGTAGVVLVGNRMELGTAGVLSLNSGRIVTGAQEVRVMNTASTAVTAGNTTSFVEGNLRRLLPASSAGSFDFPVGGATKGYQRANFNFTTTQTIHNLLAFFTENTTFVPATVECTYNYNMATVDNGFWTLNAFNSGYTALGATALGSYTATLYPTNYTNAAGSTQFTVYKRTSGTWAFNGVCSANASPAIVIRAGMNGFSDFTVAQAGNPLPIKLLNFTGKTIGLQNHLEWNTSREENSDYFILERSNDGKSFEEVSKTSARINSNSIVNYSDIDKEPFETTYYRLRMFDKNGDFAISNIVTLTLPIVKFDIGIRPNPATSKIFVDVFASESEQTQIQIMDMLGKIVLLNNIELSSGNNTIENDLSEIAKGSYFIKVTSSNGGVLFNGKFIKQ